MARGHNGAVLTDDQIEEMSPDERGELMRRLARPVDEPMPSRSWLPRTGELRVALIVLTAAALVPWIVHLAVTLPRAYVARNWVTTWVGFDVLLLVMLAATAVLALLRRKALVLTAFATGVLLVCDAWFDVMTAHAGDRSRSVLLAVLVELPLAALLIADSLRRAR